MYKSLLVIFFILFTFSLQSQPANANQLAGASDSSIKITQLKVYPNPATHFIQLEKAIGISSLIVYNLVGRKIKEFKAEKGKSYSITDLPKGMYLIQFLGLDGKVLTTQRLSKR